MEWLLIGVVVFNLEGIPEHRSAFSTARTFQTQSQCASEVVTLSETKKPKTSGIAKDDRLYYACVRIKA